jgi:hypothetical protein
MSRHILAAALAVLALVETAALAQQPPAPAPSGSAAQRKPEVIINGDRPELESLISAFVEQIAGSYYAEELARWNKDVCPLVSGLAAKEGEFILARVSEVARAAGVPLAGEHCRANLYILVTDRPEALLRGMDDRNHSFTFGDDASPTLVDSFITTPRPVRVWYHTGTTTPEGQPLVSMAFPSYVISSYKATGSLPDDYDASGQEPVAMDKSPSGEIARGTNHWSQATRLSNNFIFPIYRAFVIVDATLLEGATRGQIADYIAMVALAEIKTGARPAAAPTILNLFNAGPQHAPAGMSDWDQAYLKSLYVTEQKSKLQRRLITREMVRELIH